MTDASVGAGPQNLMQTTPAQPVVLPTNPSVSVQSAPAQNMPPTNSAPNMAKQQVSGSPWDEDVDAPLIPKNNPTIIGTLDPKVASVVPNTAPLKVPDNIEEKVGKKIPATDFIGAKNAQSPIPSPSSSTAVSGNVGQVAAQKPTPPPRGLIGTMGGLFRKKTTSKEAATANQSFAKAPESVPPVAGPNSGLKSGLVTKVEKENQNPIAKKALILVPGLVVVFALASFLTEAGLLSIGIENVYGSVGIEQIWGGLSPKTENALGRAALQMQDHPDFKAEGKISITIDRAIQSDIVTPLLTLATGQSLARDESINLSQRATQTVNTSSSDDYYYTTNSNSNFAAGSNLNNNNNNNNNNNSASLSGNANNNTTFQTTEKSFAESVSNGTKVIEGIFNLRTSSSSNEATIKLDDSSSSTISLLNDNNQLFVKTSGKVNYGSSDANKWLVYNIDQLKDKSLVASLFNLSIDSGFSVKGARAGNEKIDNTRCYKYRIDSLEIGSSLSDIGITSDMLPTLSGDVWIGIKDKLIHRLSIKITTPVSSAVRMVSLDASFSDFDVKNAITKVSSSELAVKQNLTGDDKRKADVVELLRALKEYKDDNKSYPISTDFIKLNASGNAIVKALVPRYLVSLPEDPLTASGWYYAYKSTDGVKCSISTRLENQSDKEGSLVNNVLLYLKYSSD